MLVGSPRVHTASVLMSLGYLAQRLREADVRSVVEVKLRWRYVNIQRISLVRFASCKEAPCVPERATVIPQDAEFAGALADLLADKGRVENVGEFLLPHTRTRLTMFVCGVII